MLEAYFVVRLNRQALCKLVYYQGLGSENLMFRKCRSGRAQPWDESCCVTDSGSWFQYCKTLSSTSQIELHETCLGLSLLRKDIASASIEKHNPP